MEKPRIDGKLFWQWTKENGYRISCGQAKRRFSNHYIICRPDAPFMYSAGVAWPRTAATGPTSRSISLFVPYISEETIRAMKQNDGHVIIHS